MEKRTDSKVDSNVNRSTRKEGLADKIGGAIEGIGHKISDAGAPGLGQKIHDMGDRLEKDHKDPNHPHDVSER